MKNIAILGSTGSIGNNALEVVRRFPGEFRVTGLSADSNIRLLYSQVQEFSPRFVCVRDITAARKLNQLLGKKTKLFVGEEGLEALAGQKEIEQILLAISGSSALSPLLKAIGAGKQVALANKEALVMAGDIIMNRARRNKVKIVPVDSEQSAIWQCLEGNGTKDIKNIYLTASGGPFRRKDKREMKKIKINQVMKHPRWKMGRKITVDSATLMNKGLELLEAMFLFNVPCNKIQVLVHPEAIVHSMVEFIDGVVLAQLSVTDMRIPIQYALAYPKRLANWLPRLNFHELNALHFQKPDFDKFPCLSMAYYAARALGTMPCVLNAANEVCVERFLNKELAYILIPKVIDKVISRHRNKANPDLNDIFAADRWARNQAEGIINNLN